MFLSPCHFRRLFEVPLSLLWCHYLNLLDNYFYNWSAQYSWSINVSRTTKLSGTNWDFQPLMLWQPATEKKTSHSMRRESLTDINIEDFKEYTQIISMSLDHGIQISVLVCLFLTNQKFPLRRSQSNPNPVPIRQTIVLMFLTAWRQSEQNINKYIRIVFGK